MNFLMTINTNKCFKNVSNKDIDILVNQLDAFVKTVRDDPIDYLKEWKENKIDDVKLTDFKSGFELGKKQGRIHIHILFYFNKECWFDFIKLRKLLGNIFGYKVYMNVKRIATAKTINKNLEKYVAKDLHLLKK